MKLLREYIRELLTEAPNWDSGYPHGFKNADQGHVDYRIQEDGTFNILPPKPISSTYNDIAGWIIAEAYQNNDFSRTNTRSIKFGEVTKEPRAPAAEIPGIHPGQSGLRVTPVWARVVHPELLANKWFMKSPWREYIVKAEAKLKQLEEKYGAGSLVKKLQMLAMDVTDPNSEWTKRFADDERYKGLDLQKLKLLSEDGKAYVDQAKACREGAKLQGLSYDTWVYFWGPAKWGHDYTWKNPDVIPFLEFLDMLEEYETMSKPDTSTPENAIKAGKELAEKLGERIGSGDLAKAIGKIWRKLKISPKEEIQDFMTYSRGNRSDGSPAIPMLLKKHDETTYPAGIIYEIPDEVFAVLARMYYKK